MQPLIVFPGERQKPALAPERRPVFAELMRTPAGLWLPGSALKRRIENMLVEPDGGDFVRDDLASIALWLPKQFAEEWTTWSYFRDVREDRFGIVFEGEPMSYQTGWIDAGGRLRYRIMSISFVSA